MNLIDLIEYFLHFGPSSILICDDEEAYASMNFCQAIKSFGFNFVWLQYS